MRNYLITETRGRLSREMKILIIDNMVQNKIIVEQKFSNENGKTAP